jgi:predicted outer membrane protein
MQSRNRWVWGWTLILPLAIACGGNNATNTRNGEGLDDESARIATNDGPGGTDRERQGSTGNTSASAIRDNGNAGSVGTAGAVGDRPMQGQGAGTAQAFVAAMLADGQSEVALGRLATERAANPQLKAFAQQVAADHAKGNDELAAIASRLNIKAEPPDAAHQAAQDRLSSLSGAEFDREFINTMITSHQHAVDQLRAMSGGDMPSHHEGKSGDRSAAPGGTTGATAARDNPSGANDLSAVHAWAARTTPIVQKHLDRARELQRTIAGRATQ